jgi:outer membrane protein assembly factor BamA
VVDLLQADGHLEATHQETQVALDAHRGIADVTIRLRDGPRTLVSAVRFAGNEAIPAGELAAQSRLAEGDPLSYAAVEGTRAALLALYARRGHIYARVADEERITPDRRAAEVIFRVEEGPQVRVDRVTVSGNRRTREDLVRGSLALRAGDVYDPDAAARSQAALLRLGVFRSVGLRLSRSDVPEETKDLSVELVERPWRTLSPGFGFSIANGPRAFIELVQPNLWGRAIEGAARAKVNLPLVAFRPDLEDKSVAERLEYRVEAGLHDPRFRFVPFSAGARADGVLERVHRRAYDLSRAASVFSLDLAPARRLSVTLQYELELDNVDKTGGTQDVALTRLDLERLRFPEGYTTLQSIRPVVLLDFRDSPLQPRRGWAASATLDYVRSIGTSADSWFFGLLKGSGVYTNMLKLSSVVSGYLPLGRDAVLALSFRGGRVLPLDRESQTIGPKRFFLGGASTMRGYAEDELLPEDVRGPLLDEVRACAGSLSGAACSESARDVAAGDAAISPGGEAFALAKAELRIPVRGAVEAGLFADVGNLWLDPRNAALTVLRYNVGAGLRFATPIGPAALDVGFNVEPDTRLAERRWPPHFSIGLF